MLISEMTLEQLQDYALSLEEQKRTADEQLTTKDNELNDLRTLNTTLQKRNHELFLKVEQQGARPSEELEGDKPIPTCEEVAQNIYKEIIK